MTNNTEPTRLVVQAPGPTSKGFLKRQRRALSIQRLQTGFKAQAARYRDNGQDVPGDVMEQVASVMDEIVNFILGFVVEPADRGAAVAAIEELSEDELTLLIKSIQEGGTPATPALPKTSEPPISEPSVIG